jgi:hypothetical protein
MVKSFLYRWGVPYTWLYGQLKPVRTLQNPLFSYSPKDQKAHAFAQKLKASFNDLDSQNPDAIIAIPGDGSSLYNFRFSELPHLPIFQLRPPHSNSTSHLGHHKIETAEDLTKAFNAAKAFKVHPLVCKISLSDGHHKIIYG